MRIVVTGASGFVGRHLVDELVVAGHAVVALDTRSELLRASCESVTGDLSNPEVQDRALAGGCDAIIHLATVPGGAAEMDPAASRRVNIDAMHDLLDRAVALPNCPRFVYASSIAVLGKDLPTSGVDDETPLSPVMIYGGHKAMMETAVAMFSNRGGIDGVSLRLPGILARPQGPSGMKSAFMSDLFHALKGGEAFVCPVSREATIWALSVSQCVANLIHALTCDTGLLPEGRAVTLPALRVTMGELAAEVCRQCDASESLVSWQPDEGIEQGFGSQPPLTTVAAHRAGFAGDASVATLVSRAFSTL